jgi:hypothetical protein
MTENPKAPHILNASSNLVGFCFVVLTSIRVLRLTHQTFIDDITIFSFMAFTISTLFSFLSIRSQSIRRALYEKIAEYTFILGLILIFATAMLVALNIIN